MHHVLHDEQQLSQKYGHSLRRSSDGPTIPPRNDIRLWDSASDQAELDAGLKMGPEGTEDARAFALPSFS